jgi:hypothetical protein
MITIYVIFLSLLVTHMSRKALSISDSRKPKSTKSLSIVTIKEKRIQGIDLPDKLEPDFKIDKSRAARAMAKAVSLTHKRLYGEASTNGKIRS